MTAGAPSVAAVRTVLSGVTDPEIPVITIADLGILRDVAVDGCAITVTITPTYSGCPAMEEIRSDIGKALALHGWSDVHVRMVLSPAWTTDWMSEDGRQKLLAYGIAPPGPRAAGPVLVQLGAPALRPGLAVRPSVECPQCGSGDTEELSRFASTACKSLWRCRVCREPFDHFKAH
ncbi:MAG: 1,2-phenylacetyl-CoA epoxidase subunit PaaD [Nocardioidaceae bacterium]